MKIFVRGNSLISCNLNSGFCVEHNINHQKKQVMIELIGFFDIEVKLFFRAPHILSARGVVCIERLQCLNT